MRTYVLPLLLLVAGGAACGKSPTVPTNNNTLSLRSIAPPQGSTTGNTNITINGSNFGSAVTVTVGGVAASNVALQGTTEITAVVGSNVAAGAVDVVVTSEGKSAMLPKAFTFVAPSGTNRPPAVTNIRSVGSRPGQPSAFGDQDETVTLIATVSDSETSVGSLAFSWSGPGTFSAQEPITIWHLPAEVTPSPSPVTATLTVTETYVEGSITHRNTTTAPFVMQVHDSQKEILDMGEHFLTLFSQSNVPTSEVLSDFSTTCGGRDDEAVDVNRARASYVQDFARFRVTRVLPVIFNFGGKCPFRARPADACAAFNVHWEVTYIKSDEFHSVGQHETTNGIDWVTAVLENNRWRLCASDFTGVSTSPLTGFSRHVEW